MRYKLAAYEFFSKISLQRDLYLSLRGLRRKFIVCVFKVQRYHTRVIAHFIGIGLPMDVTVFYRPNNNGDKKMLFGARVMFSTYDMALYKLLSCQYYYYYMYYDLHKKF